LHPLVDHPKDIFRGYPDFSCQILQRMRTCEQDGFDVASQNETLNVSHTQSWVTGKELKNIAHLLARQFTDGYCDLMQQAAIVPIQVKSRAIRHMQFPG